MAENPSVCDPAATLARQFPNLAGLLAFIHAETGADGFRKVLTHTPFPAEYLLLAAGELQEMDLSPVADIVLEIAKHATQQDKLCWCGQASSQFPFSWWRHPPCREGCRRLGELREDQRQKNLTPAGERFLAEVEARECTGPDEPMKGELELFWNCLHAREILRKCEGSDAWPENLRLAVYRAGMRERLPSD